MYTDKNLEIDLTRDRSVFSYIRIVTNKCRKKLLENHYLAASTA